MKSRLDKTKENLQKENFSTIMLTLNSKLSMQDAELVKTYSAWKKF